MDYHKRHASDLYTGESEGTVRRGTQGSSELLAISYLLTLEVRTQEFIL